MNLMFDIDRSIPGSCKVAGSKQDFIHKKYQKEYLINDVREI